MLLEEDAPTEEREAIGQWSYVEEPGGEATNGELAQAVLEWLETIKPLMKGHDRFQHAVARNALNMIARSEKYQWTDPRDEFATEAIESGEDTLAEPMVLMNLRQKAIEKLAADGPKYPALAVAKALWLERDEED